MKWKYFWLVWVPLNVGVSFAVGFVMGCILRGL